jgi:hypothetical protein
MGENAPPAIKSPARIERPRRAGVLRDLSRVRQRLAVRHPFRFVLRWMPGDAVTKRDLFWLIPAILAALYLSWHVLPAILESVQ